MQKQKYEKIIGKIAHVRVRNNDVWMQLLKIACESNPKETKKVLKGINKNDRKVSSLLSKLIEKM